MMPVDHAGIYNFSTFGWITGLIWKAHRKKEISTKDVPVCSEYDRSEPNSDR